MFSTNWCVLWVPHCCVELVFCVQLVFCVGVVVPSGSVSLEVVWATGDDLYLGKFGNLFSNWNADFPYPKWKALWWIAKDYGQSPAPPEHRSLHDYYAMNSY